MQVVIDVSKDKYELIKQAYRRGKYEEGDLEYAVINGIILPEEYGNLIDTNNIHSILLEDSVSLLRWYKGSEIYMELDADIIIPAKKKEEHNQ